MQDVPPPIDRRTFLGTTVTAAAMVVGATGPTDAASRVSQAIGSATRSPDAHPVKGARPLNIILIVSDTFRYDHLAFHGSKPIRTPELDALARESVVFDEAHVSSFPTIPHRTDMVTGRYGFPFYPWRPLQPDQLTVAEHLAGHGYVNQLIADCPHLMSHGYNFSRGFHGFYWVRGQEGDVPFTKMNYPVPRRMKHEKTRLKPLVFGEPLVNLSGWTNREWTWEGDRFAAQTARLADKWLEENYRAERFFLWVDFFDVHEPWDPPEYLVDLYDPGYQGDPMLHPNYGHASAYTPEELHNLWAHYAAECTLVSKHVGLLLRKIEDLGLLGNSVVVFTADHGMYIGEHDRTGKSNLSDGDERGEWPLYEEITHIPLMIRAPGIAPRRVPRHLVQPVDIMPTVLDLASVPLPDQMHGHSLKPLMDGKAEWPRKVACCSQALAADRAGSPRTTIRDSHWTLIIGDKEGTAPELYDLRSDPAQERNVFAAHRDVADRLHRDFLQWLKQVGTEEDKIKALASF